MTVAHQRYPHAAASSDRAGGVRGVTRTLQLTIEEARPKVVGIFALRFLGGALVSGGALWEPTMAAGLMSWTLIVVAVYVLNGCCDVVGDQLNQSPRPIASGRLPVSTAVKAVVVAGAAAIALATTVSTVFVLHALCALVLGAFYSIGSTASKGAPVASLVTIVSGGLLTYHAGLLASGGHTTVQYVVFSICLSAWMAVGGIVKDLTDVPGDAAAGRITLAVTRGPKATVQAAAALAFLTAVALIGAAFLVDDLLWPALLVATGTCVLLLEALLWRRLGSRRQESPYRAFMLTQYGAHITLL